MSKKKHGGDHGGGGGGHDAGGGLRWLLTYSDVVTLLLALFIFLYSISEINIVKLNAFTTSMRELFGIGRVPESGESQSGGDGILPESNSIVALQRQLEADFEELIDAGMIDVEDREEGLTLRLKDRILFGLGQSELSKEAEPILSDVAKYIRTMPNKVRVEGHTDAVPMAPGGKFASNWELSGARAASVVRFLIDRCNISPTRMSFAGYAEYKPIKPNIPLVGNAENRRVEIVVLKQIKIGKTADTTHVREIGPGSPVEPGGMSTAPATHTAPAVAPPVESHELLPEDLP
jgi:chemotaxis protein MotB